MKREKRTTAAATRSCSRGRRSPRARLPTWSWFCAHATILAPSGRASSAATRPREPSKWRVVAVPLAGQRDVQRVVEPVEPERVMAPVAERPEVGLAHLAEHERRRVGGSDPLRKLGEHVLRRVVAHGVDGVEPQPVEPVVAHPQLGVLDRPFAHPGRPVVERVAPGRLAEALGEVRRERRQRLAAGPDVVVDDVEDHAEPFAVGRVHEPCQAGGAAVRSMRSRRVEAVVAPATLAGEGGDGHQLDRRHAQPA